MAERSTLRLPLPSGLVIVTFPSLMAAGDLYAAADILTLTADLWRIKLGNPWCVPFPVVRLPALEAAGGGEG